ncbi:hypothetical protein GCM10009733_062400 [Nonomuraea maheshkhaliensis]|uniref:Ribosomal protein L7/L12 C-terminal domain-containing protein n=1 Tax=Nonomuraea maheshkhaliensis TaxID=419590 RepID=A0ABN2FQ80_9ACTN
MESVEERLARLEKEVADLRRHLGIGPGSVVPASGGPELPPRFYQELRDGKMIRAIKTYREATGASLVVAKRAVESMARRLEAGE